jgi:WhiB family redox-sensing transcriptional regulator
MSDTEFMTDGLCTRTDPELFYPGKGHLAEPAKEVCRRCPVRVECLEYALAHDERYGVWGATSARERQRLRRRQGRPTRAIQHRTQRRETARWLHTLGRSKADISRALRLSGATLDSYLTD